MSDINETLHAIGLAERLAEGVAREADRYPTENMTRVREALASARIRLEELAISADVDLDKDHSVLDEQLRRAMAAIAKEKGVDRASRNRAVPGHP